MRAPEESRIEASTDASRRSSLKVIVTEVGAESRTAPAEGRVDTTSVCAVAAVAGTTTPAAMARTTTATLRT